MERPKLRLGHIRSSEVSSPELLDRNFAMAPSKGSHLHSPKLVVSLLGYNALSGPNTMTLFTLSVFENTRRRNDRLLAT